MPLIKFWKTTVKKEMGRKEMQEILQSEIVVVIGKLKV